MSTAELTNLNPDIDVAPPTDYVDNAGPGLIPEGYYTLELKSYELVMDPESGEFKNAINLTELRVVDGPFENRTARNIRVFTKPFLRNGVKVSMLGDFLRGIDDSAEWNGLSGACSILDKAIDRNQPIRLKLTWEAFDWVGYQDEGGKDMVKKSPEEKELRKRCTIKRMQNFPQNPDGSFREKVAGPVSGDNLEARLTIDRVVPSSQQR